MFSNVSFNPLSFLPVSWGGSVQPETPQESGRYHGPPNPPRAEPPLYSPVMAACMLAVGAQLSGLAYSGSDDSTP